jgi:lipid-A-disaccharide synthase
VSKSLLVIAGEISGDQHVAPIVQTVQEKLPGLHCWGVGGDALRATGMDIHYDVRDMAVLGLSEVLKRYGFFRRVFHDLLRQLDEHRPDAVLLVDYPGFNLRFAKQAQRRGVKVLYYICPQVWAWHQSRIGRMAAIVDRLMVIFPFEVDVFKGTDLRVDFVGHPLVQRTRDALQAPPLALPWPAGDRRVALLPGSRRQEIERILPVLLDTASRLKQKDARCSFLIAAPNDRIAAHVEQVMAAQVPDTPAIDIVIGQTREVLRQARAAMVASGTATLETALMGCPMIIVYKTALFTYWMGKRLIRVPHLGMVNLVGKKLICPEFLQDAAQPEAMADAMEKLIGDTPERAEMVSALRDIAAHLGEADATAAAAEIVLEELTD